jgi:hypothetical protein
VCSGIIFDYFKFETGITWPEKKMKDILSPVAGLAKKVDFNRTEAKGDGPTGEFNLSIKQALREFNGRASGSDPLREGNLEKLTQVIRFLEMQMRFNEGLFQIIRGMDGREGTVGQAGGNMSSSSLSSLASVLTDAKTNKGEGILERYSRVYSSSTRETSIESRLASLERRIEEQRRSVPAGEPSIRSENGAPVQQKPAGEKSAYVMRDEDAQRRVTEANRKVNSGAAKTKAETSAYEEVIDYASKTYGVDPDLVKAVIRAESSYNPESTSAKGAMGLMQLMPETAKDLGVNDPYDPAENIMGGTRYLKGLLDRFGNNRNLALAAYNWGMGNVERKPDRMPQETRTYVARVNQYYRENKV